MLCYELQQMSFILPYPSMQLKQLTFFLIQGFQPIMLNSLGLSVNMVKSFYLGDFYLL